MGQIKKQGVFNSISTYFGIAVGAVNTIVLFPYAFPGEDEKWGLIQFMLAIGLVISGFSNLGLAKSLPRFLPSHPEHKKQLISFGVLVSLIGAIVFSVFAFAFKPQVVEWLKADALFDQYFFIFVPLVVFLMMNELLTGIFQGFLRTRLPLFLNEAGVRLGMTAVLVAHAILQFDYLTFLILFLSVYGMRSLILLVEYIRKYRISLFIAYDKAVIREFMNYGFVTIFTASTAVLITKIDQIFVGAYDLQQLAYYGLAFYLGSLILAPARALTPISFPVMANAWKKGNKEAVKTIYHKSALNSLLVGGALFWAMWLVLDDVYTFLPDKYAGGKTVFLIIGLSRVFGTSMGLNGLVINTSSIYRVNIPFSIITTVVAIAANYFLIPIYGINGAALAVLSIAVVDNLMKFLILLIKYKMQPFQKSNLVALLVISLPGVIVYVLPFAFPPLLNIIVVGGLYFVLFLPLVMYSNVSPDISDLAKRLLSKLGIIKGG